MPPRHLSYRALCIKPEEQIWAAVAKVHCNKIDVKGVKSILKAFVPFLVPPSTWLVGPGGWGWGVGRSDRPLNAFPEIWPEGVKRDCE